MDKFGERLRTAREANGLTQIELGEKVYMQQQTIHRYERKGQLPTVDTAVRISQALGVTLDWLIGLTDEGGPKA